MKADVVAHLGDIPNPGLLGVTLPNGDRVVLIRRGNVVSALVDTCPHQSMPLSSGELLADGTVECPWHGARFDCVSGVCQRGPATDDVGAYEVVMDGEKVMVGALLG